MAERRFDVLGIGNAIVDILARCEEDFLVNERIQKGSMTLIDEDRAEYLFTRMGTMTTVSGGSAANTIAGLASFGGKGAYIGKINDDQLGAVFGHDMKALGVHFNTRPASYGPPTACCMIFITPDSQRSMNTFLGACVELGPEDIDEVVVGEARVVYMEGYLFDKPAAKEAFYKAARAAHARDTEVALTLSDTFCVNRHREDFKKFIEDSVDILFANEAEACALYEKNTLDEALPLLLKACKLLVITRGAEGSIVICPDERAVVPAEATQLVDTTGAGDLYAAGFLYGYTHGQSLATSARLGSLAAAEVISHIGPRPQVSLKKLAEKAGVVA